MMVRYLKHLLLLTGLTLPVISFAANLGVFGQTFPITEPDLLQLIQARLTELAQTGQLQQIQQKMAETTIARMNHPTPVVGLVKATQNRSYLINPSITLSQNIYLSDGKLLGQQGQVINPLDTVSLPKPLAFFDATDKSQVDWALKQYKSNDGKINLILVNGNPIDLIKAWHIPIYFDQGGRLSQKLHLRAVPSIVTQQDKFLKVTEVRV